MTTPSSRSQKLAERNLAQRKDLWPSVSADEIWNRKESAGFTTIPRSLPYFLRIMNSGGTAKRLSETYFGLWARANDQGFVQLHGRGDEMAYEAGFSASRAVYTWEGRLDALESLGFIKLASGGGRKRGFALLLNPFHVVARLKKEGKVSPDDWNNLLIFMNNFGAKEQPRMRLIEKGDDEALPSRLRKRTRSR